MQKDDVWRVQSLQQEQWRENLAKEGLDIIVPEKSVEGSDPPCPACGHQGPLQDGACGDCGLQLG